MYGIFTYITGWFSGQLLINFHQWRYPPKLSIDGIFHDKASISGYLHVWKPIYGDESKLQTYEMTICGGKNHSWTSYFGVPRCTTTFVIAIFGGNRHPLTSNFRVLLTHNHAPSEVIGVRAFQLPSVMTWGYLLSELDRFISCCDHKTLLFLLDLHICDAGGFSGGLFSIGLWSQLPFEWKNKPDTSPKKLLRYSKNA